MKEIKSKNRTTYFILDPEDSMEFKGGRLWPFIDLKKIFSEIMYGEDLFFKDCNQK